MTGVPPPILRRDPPWDGGADAVELELDLFRPVRVKPIEVKAHRKGHRYELACRWCKRRGYHLSWCLRGSAQRACDEVTLRWSYVLELAGASSPTRGGRMR